MKETEVVIMYHIEEEEEGEDGQTSTRRQSSVIDVINLDIFNGNVLLGTNNHFIQSLMRKRNCS